VLSSAAATAVIADCVEPHQSSGRRTKVQSYYSYHRITALTYATSILYSEYAHVSATATNL